MPDFDLNLNRLGWVRQCVDKQDACFRPVLDGVRIEPREAGGVWMIATDGLALAVAKDEDGKAPFPCTIQLDKTLADFVGPTVDADPCDGESCRVWHITDNHRLRFDGLEAPGECAVAKTGFVGARQTGAGGVTGLVWRVQEMPKSGWIDWRRVLRARDCPHPARAGDVGTFNPAMINRFSYQEHGVAIMPRSGVAMESNKWATPGALVLAEGAPWGFGVLMPRKVNVMADLGETLRELVERHDMPPHGNAITQAALDAMAGKDSV